MQISPQVLVKFKKGEKVLFDIEGHDDFVRLVEEVAKLWGIWIYIGPNAVVRKSDIESLYYLKDGWNSQVASNQIHN